MEKKSCLFGCMHGCHVFVCLSYLLFNYFICILLLLLIFCVLVCRKNGKLVGNVRLDIKGPLYPLVALHSPNEEYAIPSIMLYLQLFLLINHGHVILYYGAIWFAVMCKHYCALCRNLCILPRLAQQ